MDVPRPKTTNRRTLYLSIGGGLVVLLATLGLARMKPAAPSVERQSVLMDAVKRGPMVFEVRGTGTLVPVDIRMITAQTPCRVERIRVYPGTAVKADTVIAELSSPELQQAAQDALWQYRKAEADYEMNRLGQRTSVASARSQAQAAEVRYKAMERLGKEGLQSSMEVMTAKVDSEERTGRLASEEARMKMYENHGGKVAPARAELERARALWQLKQEQVAALQLRAGMDGVLQELPLQVGQQLAPGAELAKVARPLPLKAALKVSETQAKDIVIGQPVSIDTRNGIVKGRVIRIDPAVQNGTVTVDASLEGELPKGLRPDLSVEGVIELDRVSSALFVGRPVQAQAHAGLSVFKVLPGGSEAIRVKVQLGRGSVSTIEVLDGLREGDQIILSDTSTYDNSDRLRLK
ncbi:MAG TPA: efflux RND transporter periplasmic adaptor subunit [Holophaga sp.]|nr:efflux RND transporter periplasmic adaptor subunit [Holophaga sp.]